MRMLPPVMATLLSAWMPSSAARIVSVPPVSVMPPPLWIKSASVQS